MLKKCANPACTAIFRYLREGKMFYVETEVFATADLSFPNAERKKGSRRLEHYWLCEACCVHVTLTFDQHKGVLTVPLPDGVGKKTIRMMSPERVLA
jgi:hypothetical protein